MALRKVSCFKTSLYFTLCLNAEKFEIDSWPTSIVSHIYILIMFLSYIQKCMKFHLILVLFVYSVSFLKATGRPCHEFVFQIQDFLHDHEMENTVS